MDANATTLRQMTAALSTYAGRTLALADLAETRRLRAGIATLTALMAAQA